MISAITTKMGIKIAAKWLLLVGVGMGVGVGVGTTI